jgi:hypothetical protein
MDLVKNIAPPKKKNLTTDPQKTNKRGGSKMHRREDKERFK